VLFRSMPVDGQIDRLEPLQVGQIGVRMAPTHHGIEGSHYGLLIAAISAKALTSASAGVGASALFPRLPGNKLVFDPTGTTPVDISGQVFPAFPEGAKFNYSGQADGAVPARSFRMSGAVTGVNVVRVSFSDSLQTRWDIMVDPASPGFTVPPVPGALRDRLFTNGNSATGARSDLVVQAFRMTKDPLTTGSPAVTFTDFVELNDTNGDRTTDFLTAFSFLSYGAPSISFKTPSTNPANITKGSNIVITTKSFVIGPNDGAVQLSFAGGTGCTNTVLTTETTAGNGELSYTLPMSCTGNGITVRAELVKTIGPAVLNPAVAATITATIQ
jgi:hypothetical protein